MIYLRDHYVGEFIASHPILENKWEKERSINFFFLIYTLVYYSLYFLALVYFNFFNFKKNRVIKNGKIKNVVNEFLLFNNFSDVE